MHEDHVLNSADPVDIGTQSDQICATQLVITERPPTVHIGGYRTHAPGPTVTLCHEVHRLRDARASRFLIELPQAAFGRQVV